MQAPPRKGCSLQKVRGSNPSAPTFLPALAGSKLKPRFSRKVNSGVDLVPGRDFILMEVPSVSVQDVGTICHTASHAGRHTKSQDDPSSATRAVARLRARSASFRSKDAAWAVSGPPETLEGVMDLLAE